MLLVGCQREAVHLELRDTYAIHTEAERFGRFMATGRHDHEAEAPDRQKWQSLSRSITPSGSTIRLQ
jgi:hypothetical protein